AASVRAVWGATAHLSRPSFQTLVHSSPPVHGSPAWIVHRRPFSPVPLHVSEPLQKTLSLHALFASNRELLAVHGGPPVHVPLVKGAPTESAIVVPAPSLIPHRATSPLPEVISWNMVLWICAWLRAELQMRTSSIIPAKNPSCPGASADFCMVARPAGWMLSERGVKAPTARVFS